MNSVFRHSQWQHAAFALLLLSFSVTGCQRSGRMHAGLFSRFWGFNSQESCGDTISCGETADSGQRGWLAKFTAPHQISQDGFDAGSDPFLTLGLEDDTVDASLGGAADSQIASAPTQLNGSADEALAFQSNQTLTAAGASAAEERYPWEIEEQTTSNNADEIATLFQVEGQASQQRGEVAPSTAAADDATPSKLNKRPAGSGPIRTAAAADSEAEGNPFLLVQKTGPVTDISSTTKPNSGDNTVSAGSPAENPVIKSGDGKQLERLRQALDADSQRKQQTPPPRTLQPNVVRNRVERMMQQARQHADRGALTPALRIAHAAEQLAQLSEVFFGPDEDNPSDLVKSLSARIESRGATASNIVADTNPFAAGDGEKPLGTQPDREALEKTTVSTPPNESSRANSLPVATADPATKSALSPDMNPFVPSPDDTANTTEVVKRNAESPPKSGLDSLNSSQSPTAQSVPLAPPAEPTVIASRTPQPGVLTDFDSARPNRVIANRSASVPLQSGVTVGRNRKPLESLPPLEVAMTEPQPRASRPVVAPLPRPTAVDNPAPTLETSATTQGATNAPLEISDLYKQPQQPLTAHQAIPNVQWENNVPEPGKMKSMPDWLIPCGVGVGLFVVIVLTYLRQGEVDDAEEESPRAN